MYSLKRRRILALRISLKRLRLVGLTVVGVLCCIYLLLANSIVSVSIFRTWSFFDFNDFEVEPGVRLIYTADLSPWFNSQIATKHFRESKCPLQNCWFTSNMKALRKADSVLFLSRFDEKLTQSYERPSKQSWIFMSHEAAIRERDAVSTAGHLFNYTVTYLRESTLFLPYWTFVANNSWNLTENGDPAVVSRRIVQSTVSQKQGKVAWLVSNCHDVQNNRYEYAQELGKFIQVDIFGGCGKRCSELPGVMDNRQNCYDYVAKNYKFYLAFENANCVEYITEKLLNAFNMGLLPIVMGARPADYVKLAPPHSFIHIEDFPDPQQLADYLHLLDSNSTLYNSYFAWQQLGIVAEPRYFEPHYWCRICMLVNDQANGTSIRNTLNDVKVDLATWWTKNRCLRKGKRWDMATPDDFA